MSEVTMNRLKNISSLNTTEFDVCIIGGGATGAGCALDAAQRGLKTLLIEKDDFASGTSSKSTKMFHGGVRYLEKAVRTFDREQFRMVYKSLHERHALINNARHLAHPIALLTPCYKFGEGLYYTIGLKIYDLLAGSTNLKSSQWLNKKQSLEHIPNLKADKLRSSVLYYDGQFDDIRYTMEVVKTATELGCTVINHISADEFCFDGSGKLNQLTVTDLIRNKTSIVTSKVFVNATGTGADKIRLKANPNLNKRMRMSKGAHLVLPFDIMPSKTALLIPKTDDGRVIFLLPWNKKILVGTTDDEMENTDKESTVNATDVKYLLDYTARYLNTNIEPKNVRAGFSGLRPLLQAVSGNTKDLVRDHEVEIDEASGLISIMGGKWTTFRIMAKDTIDAVEQYLQRLITPCKTQGLVLVGGRDYDPAAHNQLVLKYKIPEFIAKRLNQRYGASASKILELTVSDPSLRRSIVAGSPVLCAEVVYNIIYEMGVTLRDVIARRLGLEFTSWKYAYQSSYAVANIMQDIMRFSSEEKKGMVNEYQQLLDSWNKEAFGVSINATKESETVEI